jgi:predicted PurR-regulated permease PerM
MTEPHANGLRTPAPASAASRRRRPIRIEITARSVVVTLAVLAACWCLVRLTPVLLMIVAALMLVGLLNPVVDRLEAAGVRRGRAIGLVFGLLAAVVLLIVTLTIPELISQAGVLIENEPAMRAKLADALASHAMTSSLAGTLRHLDYTTLLGGSAGRALATSLQVVEVVAYGVGAVFLGLYVMLDAARLRGYLYALVPRREHIRLTRIVVNLESIVGGYIRGQLITCAAMGLFMFVLLSVVGVQSALALSVLAGLADVLPYVGGLIALIPAVLASLPMGALVAGGVGAAILVYQEIESRLIVPMVYGKSLRLPSSVVLVALLAGGSLAGIVGALLALPFASAMLMLLGELRVQLPGQDDTDARDELRSADERTAREYDERTVGMSAHDAASVAVEIVESQETDPPAADERPLPRAPD